MMRASCDLGMWIGLSPSSPTCSTDSDLALVGGRRNGAAVQRLQPLGVAEPRVEAARDVHGDVLAADATASA